MDIIVKPAHTATLALSILAERRVDTVEKNYADSMKDLIILSERLYFTRLFLAGGLGDYREGRSI